jgi:5-methylcytosine-specific restriction protein B
MNITDSIKKFSQSYKKEVLKPHSKELNSYQILVKQLPPKINEITSLYSDEIILRGSIGAGVNTFYPWFGIFDKRVSTGATNGFYLVLLFSNDFDDIYLTLNQGSTIQSKSLIESNRNFVYSQFNQIDGFEKGKLPVGSLVKVKTESSSNNGKKYEETNIYYKKYSIQNLNEKTFLNDLNKLLNIYITCVDEFIKKSNSDYSIKTIEFDVNNINKSIQKSGLFFSDIIMKRFVASLQTKPFVILSGLSGSGKTKLAQSFVQWICEEESQYKIVPVGADWTNREPLVGYPNGLVADEYITPDSGVIHLLMEAVKEENGNKPFFLILDEMNLSHVERYFADFLSIMESNDTIKLYTGAKRKSLDGLEIDLEIGWPKNVFIIGTVNIDETTYMFSPKVLDRANVIEFRITETEIESFLANPSTPDLSKLTKQGVSMAESFLSIAHSDSIAKNDNLAKELVSFFKHLQLVGAEFGYRSASEMMQLVTKLKMLDKTISDNSCLDIAIMQKLLPKLHGSRSKLVKILIALSGLCIEGITVEEFEKKFDDFYKNDFEGIEKKYPISFEKIIRMYKNVLANGFTSYAEA